MPPALRDLQRRFAAQLAADERLALYANTIRARYRNALAATYPAVCELVGPATFDAAIDAFVSVHPPGSGDLNDYGSGFADFLARYEPNCDRRWLPDLARLEWALDEAARAADVDGSPPATLAALGAMADPAAVRLELHPSCRLVASDFPVMRIWQSRRCALGAPERLLVRRERDTPAVERLEDAQFAWLAALAADATLEAALDAALRFDPRFDLAAALRTRIADGTITGASASPAP